MDAPISENGGYSLMYKGPGAAEELKAAESALKCLNGTAELREIDTEWGARSLVLIKNTEQCPKNTRDARVLPQKSALRLFANHLLILTVSSFLGEIIHSFAIKCG